VAIGWSANICVTVHVGGIRFVRPISVGNLIEVRARLIHTGRSSMHVAVDVLASDPREGEFAQATHCILGYVAVDERGRPVPIPAWQPVSEDDLALQQHAIEAMALSKAIEAEMSRYIVDT
jgi:acyl-CoA hydrolase